jgi:hypothetical protein
MTIKGRLRKTISSGKEERKRQSRDALMKVKEEGSACSGTTSSIEMDLANRYCKICKRKTHLLQCEVASLSKAEWTMLSTIWKSDISERPVRACECE